MQECLKLQLRRDKSWRKCFSIWNCIIYHLIHFLLCVYISEVQISPCPPKVESWGQTKFRSNYALLGTKSTHIISFSCQFLNIDFNHLRLLCISNFLRMFTLLGNYNFFSEYTIYFSISSLIIKFSAKSKI